MWDIKVIGIVHMARIYSYKCSSIKEVHPYITDKMVSLLFCLNQNGIFCFYMAEYGLAPLEKLVYLLGCGILVVGSLKCAVIPKGHSLTDIDPCAFRALNHINKIKQRLNTYLNTLIRGLPIIFLVHQPLFNCKNHWKIVLLIFKYIIHFKLFDNCVF